MNRIIITGVFVVGLVLAGAMWLALVKEKAAKAEREKIQNALIADTNQKIAERRILDATFDKDDAAAFCKRNGLAWVFDNERSHCE